MKRSILFIALAAILLSFVSYDEAEESNEEMYGYPDSTVKATFKILEKKYSSVPFFSKINDQYLFYVVNGEWIDTSRTTFAKGNFLMGLVNDKQEIILPVEYNKIYNPDATAKGYIEIEKNGKRGLLNYYSKKIIAPEFDVIYNKTSFWDVIAIGRIGAKYYKISAEGKKTEITDVQEYGTQAYYLTKGKQVFNINSKGEMIFDLYPRKGEWADTARIRGLLITPSYLFDLKFNEIYTELDLTETLYGTNELEFNVSYPWEKSKNVFAFLTNFIERGVMERSWTIEHNSIVTTDSLGTAIDYLEIKDKDKFYPLYMSANELNYYLKEQKNYEAWYVNDSIVRIHYLTDSIDRYHSYDLFGYDCFYSISTEGKITPLQSNRIFDISKYIVMSEYDFEGFYLKDTTKEGFDYYGEGLVLQHIPLKDLELMRNEIYADYGYKFKDKKWKKYFSAQPWYEGKYDDIAMFLTDIDKRNLELIEIRLKEMKKNEKKFTKPIYLQYFIGE